MRSVACLRVALESVSTAAAMLGVRHLESSALRSYFGLSSLHARTFRLQPLSSPFLIKRLLCL